MGQLLRQMWKRRLTGGNDLPHRCERAVRSAGTDSNGAWSPSQRQTVPHSSSQLTQSPLVPLFSPRHISSWGRFSRRRSFEPADRAPRPFLWRRAPWRTGTAPAQTRRTRSPSSRWPTAAAWRWTPLWAAFSHWSSLGGISFLWWQEKFIRRSEIRALRLSTDRMFGQPWADQAQSFNLQHSNVQFHSSVFSISQSGCTHSNQPHQPWVPIDHIKSPRSYLRSQYATEPHAAPHELAFQCAPAIDCFFL